MKDIFMYLFTIVGVGFLVYVRSKGAERVKHPGEPEGWTKDEKKLLFVAFGCIAIALILAFIPNK